MNSFTIFLYLLTIFFKRLKEKGTHLFISNEAFLSNENLFTIYLYLLTIFFKRLNKIVVGSSTQSLRAIGKSLKENSEWGISA